MKTWHGFYQYKCNNDYFQYITDKYKTFIDEVLKNVKPNMLIAEFGCGMGNITKALMQKSNKGQYIILDNSNLMLDLAEQNLNMFNVNIECWDILSEYPSKFDLIHSHGVLEHFSDIGIKRIIKNQLLICDNLIHYVPSNKYTYQSYGDERLLSKEYWQKEFKPTQIIEFNDGYDLILKWTRT